MRCRPQKVSVVGRGGPWDTMGRLGGLERSLGVRWRSPRALGILGGIPWGPWGVPWGSVGSLGGPWAVLGVLGGSLGCPWGGTWGRMGGH